VRAANGVRDVGRIRSLGGDSGNQQSSVRHSVKQLRAEPRIVFKRPFAQRKDL
jgi:hypothetical protein